MQDFDVIETPENVELEQPLAGIGSRFLAGLIDNLLIVGGMMVVLIIVGVASSMSLRDMGRWELVFLFVAAFAIYWGYFGFFEYLTNGQTPGKKAVGLRVVKEGGAPIAFADIAIRNLLRVVDMIGGYAVAGICMFVTRKAQRLGDLAAGTVVVSEQVQDYAAKSDVRTKAKWQQEASGAALRATGLTPEEYRLVSNYWLRRYQLTPEARSRVLPHLMAPIIKRMNVRVEEGSFAELEVIVDGLMQRAAEAETQSRTEAGSGKP